MGGRSEPETGDGLIEDTLGLTQSVSAEQAPPALDQPTAPVLRRPAPREPETPPTDPAHPPAEPAGPWSADLRLPGYTLDAPLAHGGMAQVWRARRLTTAGVQVPCVVKAILAGKEEDPQFQRKFIEEAEIYARLRHPNLVQVLDVGRVEGRLYLAMEWIEGLDGTALIVSARKRQVEIPLPHSIYVLKHTLQGLHHAHTARDGGFVHRDISPGNILISRDGAVKLADFGVARSVESLASQRRRTVAGKLHYFAPELVTGRANASVQSDIFALGVTFYEMLTCAPLFPRRAKWPELRATIAAFDPHRLIEDDLTMPEGLEALLLRCLAAEPGDRYGSALEFLEDVSDFAYETGIRLLDAHFARYIQRVLELRGGAARPSLAAATRDDG
jgi:eukaryotic-like serine/threonine-protein kinase